MKNYLLFAILLVLFGAGLGFSAAYPDQDYFGFLDYTPSFNVTYLFHINSSYNTISFKGINDSNLVHYVLFPLDSSNSFTQRINYVWYYGVFNETHLMVNSYVPAEIFYVGNFTEISDGVYSSYFSLNNSFFDFGNSSFNVTLDLNSNLSFIQSNDYLLNSSNSSLLYAPDFRMAAHLQNQGLIETRLVQNQTIESLEVHLWIKEDLFRNGLGYQWINQIYPVNNFSFELISPSNNQTLLTENNFLDVKFDFLTNSTYSFVTNDCLINLSSNNFSIILNSSLNGSYNSAIYNLSLGSYEWFVSCAFESLNWVSNKSFFTIQQKISEPEVIILNSDSEEGGRRRNILPLENLSFNPLTLEENDSNNTLISLITGAVTGVLGNKGLLGLGVLLLLVGLIVFLIYNRQRFGIVKTSKP